MNFISRLFHTKKLPVSLLAVALLSSGCSEWRLKKNSDFTPTQGDLLFQDIDCGPLCDAIEKVTTGYGGADFSHVGIVAKDSNNNFVVIEAVQNGVLTTPLKDFLSRSLNSNDQPKVAAGRLKHRWRHLIPIALEQAAALKAKPYDKAFAIDNDAYYCSELIYEIFLRANNNKPVFTLRPMTFKDPDTGTVMPTWDEYFRELGIAVPQDKPGINPGGISRSPAINIVHSYGGITQK